MKDDAMVDSEHVSDGQTTIVFWLANVLPGTEVKGRNGIVLLNASPLEPPNDGSDFLNESLREEHSGHIVNRDGGKDGFDVGEAASMVKFVCFGSGQFCFEFIGYEFIGFGAIRVIEDERVPKVHGVRGRSVTWKIALTEFLVCWSTCLLNKMVVC